VTDSPGDIKDLGDAAFENIRTLIQAETGIHLRDSKRILVSNRLRSRLRALGLGSYDEYYELLTRPGKGRDEMYNFIDAISTNETYFYRGENQFDALRLDILPGLFKSRGEVRIWSAACSTGEEPYSVLIAADASARAHVWNGTVKVIATDISTSALAVAQEGVYDQRALRALPQGYLKTYLNRTDDGRYKVSETVRSRVRFERHNLLKDRAPDGPMDIILCRNALMYFTRETQEQIVKRCIEPALRDDGYLFIGSSESFVGMKTSFRYAGIRKCQIYVKSEQRNDDP